MKKLFFINTLSLLIAWGLCLSLTYGVTRVAQKSDLENAWSNRMVVATNLPDTVGQNAWTVGWIDQPGGYADITSFMKEWGWPDNGAAPPPNPPAFGYSWNGTHDTGWASYVGFESTFAADPGGYITVRSNGTSTIVLKWTAATTGTYDIYYQLQGFGNNYAAAIYSSASSGWIGDSTHNPENGTLEAWGFAMTATNVNLVAGDYLLFQYDSTIGGTAGNSQGRIEALTIDLLPVPEPGSFLLFASGAVLLYRRLRKKA